MLKMSRRGAVQDVRNLAVQEDQALRWAFGRFTEPNARTAGAAVIRCYQRVSAGCWILLAFDGERERCVSQCYPQVDARDPRWNDGGAYWAPPPLVLGRLLRRLVTVLQEPCLVGSL